MKNDGDQILSSLKERGYRMTPQRRAIVLEVMRTSGHIAPPDLAQRVKDRLPGVNDSTVYRTLELLEDIGVLSHAHLGSGPEYHRAERSDHVHLICSRCDRRVQLRAEDTEPLKKIVQEQSGFVPDFTHFAISGLCARCRREQEQAP